jgi:hypothetical protein
MYAVCAPTSDGDHLLWSMCTGEYAISINYSGVCVPKSLISGVRAKISHYVFWVRKERYLSPQITQDNAIHITFSAASQESIGVHLLLTEKNKVRAYLHY